MRKFLAFLVFSILLMSSPALALAASSTAKTMAGQSHPAASDAQLEATIRTKLAKSKIGKDGFRFHVQRGVVTWEGETAVGQHKGAATRMARSSGVIQVINNIKVSNSSKETPMRRAYVKP